ncbi:hypothetical protein C5167_047750 [Papaver somniferum]|uniref:Treslin N-terminal domain-containing protein n=1 Tax=Papaver somniferum TaxID=3469 RepID=A0A4Y7LIB2_PAPSO|nr:hypothetical protein C5167_047750 [Papaver somniferum]
MDSTLEIDLNQTQRIVFLIDLHPLFTQPQNPKSYISSILTSTQKLLEFSPLSSSLFAFKFFISSLSPVLSSSKIGKFGSSFSFDSQSQTLVSLTEALDSFSPILKPIDENALESVSKLPRCHNVAEAVREVMLKYTWEDGAEDFKGMVDCSCVKRNLILVFSPAFKSSKLVGDFVGIEGDELVSERFSEKFGGLRDGFVSRDIHLSWVSVNYEENVENEGDFSEIMESGVKRLGWGFCSTDAINLGSSLVPFGLIYPKIGCSKLGGDDACGKKCRAELNLEILDVNGRPLECNCCELEMTELKVSRRRPMCNSGVLESRGSSDEGRMFWGNGSDQRRKLCVKEVRKSDEIVNIKGKVCDLLLIRGFSGDQKNDGKVDTTQGVFFADRVLEMLRMEKSEFTPGKPIWQLLQAFLYRGSYSALVTVLNKDGVSLTGIMKPFTINLAFLYVLDGALSFNELLSEADEVCSGFEQCSVKQLSETPNMDAELSTPADTQNGELSSQKSSESQGGIMRKNRKGLKFVQNLSWSSFCQAALRNTEMNLEEIYIDRECNHSKKFKFLKCWMRQTRKLSSQTRIKPHEQEQQHVSANEETQNRLMKLEQESELPISSSFSIGEASAEVAPDMNDGATPAWSETSETFLSSISEKIQQSLIFEDMELGALAERLVYSSVHWLYRKHETDNTIENSNSKEQSEDGCGGLVAAELIKLLLVDPKDLAMKYKSSDPSAILSDSTSTAYTSEYKVREMEILQSKVGGSVKESTKQKMVKQICSFLETIQLHHAEGFWGDFSLDAYVRKTIKKRYAHSLEDVVHRICTRMDLLLFEEDEGELSGSLFNSEDSENPRREIVGENDIGGNVGTNPSTSTGKSSRRRETYSKALRGLRKEHKITSVEAQERKVKNCKLHSFAKGINLRKVWAPNQPNTVITKSEVTRKVPKRKERRHYDVVCETPMSRNKRSCMGDEGQSNDWTDFFGSVSKSLFQDNNGGDSNRTSTGS